MHLRFVIITLFLTGCVLCSAFAGDKNQKGKGFDVQMIDKSVKPGTDFYQYAVGNWIKNNPIPDEYSRYGSFELLQERNNTILKEILERASTAQSEKGTALQKVGDFYFTGMDTVKIEAEGFNPIKPQLETIDNLLDKNELVLQIARMHAGGISVLFGFYAMVDAKNSSMMAAGLSQGSLGLPDVEYYTKEDARSKEIREQYVLHCAKMMQLTGVDSITSMQYGRNILALETQLARNSNTRLENRDPLKTYNKVQLSSLQHEQGIFYWNRYFSELSIDPPMEIIVAQPRYFKQMVSIFEQVPLEEWKVYLKWRVIRDAAEALSSDFEREYFAFNGKFLTGQKVMKPRWKRVLAAVNGSLGELLGQLYVGKVFPPEAKAKASAIVNNLLVAMGERVNGLEWMGDATKKAALIKLKNFTVKIGYPDKWKDYSKLNIERDSYYANMVSASRWARAINLTKIGKPVDKTEWGMSPQTVNAYYSPVKNEIVFPAAILQPPFFNPEADDAINYGAMGVVIGHEISHGFDDQGRKFDASGNLTDWWTKEDNDKFQARAQKLIDQFNEFAAIDTFKVNGALTLGENIGDLGGLNVSFTAFKKTEQFKNKVSFDGFTPEQRFFLGFAQIWAEIYRPEALKLRLKTDVHSPGKFRVIGPLKNMPEFFEAFSIEKGEYMRASDEKLVKIW